MCKGRYAVVFGIVVSVFVGLDRLSAGDCNENGRDDLEDIAAGDSPDCDGDGVPDECDLAPRFRVSEASFPRGAEITSVAVLRAGGGTRASSRLVAGSLDGQLWEIVWDPHRYERVPRASVEVGESVLSLASGDLDRDRYDELIAHDPRGGEVFILQSDPEGLRIVGRHRVSDEDPERCGPVVSYSCYASSSALEVADLDGDGDLDIAAANLRPENRVAVLLNKGRGRLADPVGYNALGAARNVASGDIDGDGDADLVVHGDLSATVFLNGGDGSFDEREPLDIDAGVVALADVDGDGRAELLAASGDSLRFFGYEPARPVRWNESRAIHGLGRVRGIFPVDSDLDRDLDLMLLGENTVTLLRNERASFGAPETSVLGHDEVRTAAVDDRGGFYPDLAAVSDREFYLHENPEDTRALASLRAETDGEVRRFLVSEFNDDGLEDLAVTVGRDAGPGVSVAVFHGSWGTVRPELRAATTLSIDGEDTALAAADLDGDGASELLVGGPGRVFVFPNDGRRLQPPAELSLQGSPVGLLSDDFDGDGDADLAAVSELGVGAVASVFLNDGAGAFGMPREVAIEGTPSGVSSADLDGDGDVEIIVARGGMEILALLNDGAGEFSEMRSIPHGRTIRSIAAEDMDTDGLADLVLGLDDTLLVLWGSPGGTFDDTTSIEGRASELATGDVEGDGDMDVVLPAAGRLVLNLGNRDFAGVRLAPPVLGSARFVDLDDVTPGLDIALAPSGSRIVDVLLQTEPPRRDLDGNGVLDPCGDIPPFRRGDIDADGRSNLTDGIVLLRFLFRDGPEPPCQDSADVDDNGRLEITDVVRLLGGIFQGSEPPPPPVESCGFDFTTEDSLTCDSFPPCR